MTSTTSTTSYSTVATSIDMYTPAQTCEQLAMSDLALLDMVNAGQIAAYKLGGNIRFKVTDVHAALSQLTAA